MRVLFYLFCVKGARRERYSPFSWRICFSASSARRSACFLASSTNFCFSCFCGNFGYGIRCLFYQLFSLSFCCFYQFLSCFFGFFLILVTCSSVVPLPARASTTLFPTACFTIDLVSISIVGLVKVPPILALMTPT